MQFQKPKNPSAEKHSQWQVRHIVGMAVHVGLGGTAQLFQFRKKDEHAVFDFVFIGAGLGVGKQLGAGAASFPGPIEFFAGTGKLVGQAFWEAGREMLGGKAQAIPDPEFVKTIGAFNDIETRGPFSAIDFNGSFGRLTSASASAAFGYGVTFITAFSLSQTFFDGQSAAGEDTLIAGTTGASAGANVNSGIWLMVN